MHLLHHHYTTSQQHNSLMAFCWLLTDPLLEKESYDAVSGAATACVSGPQTFMCTYKTLLSSLV